jgi:HPt (histidine-containing phosphotransfer) domain-containing protein
MDEQPNLDYFNQIADGDEHIITTLTSILKNEFPEQLEDYNKCISELKYEEAAEALHKLKHKIGLLGLENGYKIANDYEHNLREYNLQNKNEFEAILKNITNFIKKL